MKVTKLKPFKKFCVTIGEIPASYLESMSYYEVLIWFCKYLQETVIPTINHNSEVIEEVQTHFETLKNYVDTYFDNLDVQEEINNKLDEMAESGKLAEIINEQIFGELNDKINNVDADVKTLKNEVKYHFITTGINSGDCILLELESKNYLVDLSNNTSSLPIRTYLTNNDITHLDGIIVTHYHADHVGGEQAQALIELLSSNFVDENTTLYLPLDPVYSNFIDDDTNVVSRINAIKTAINNAVNQLNINVVTVETNQTLTDKNTTLRFLNSDSVSFANYYNVTTDSNDNITTHTTYNNFSLVIEVKNINDYLLLASDIQKEAEAQVSKYLNNKINIKKVAHHGVNHSANKDYLINSLSDLNVIMNTTTLSGDNAGRYDEISYNLTHNAKMYQTENNGTMVFVDNGNMVYPIENYDLSNFAYPNAVTGFDAIGVDGFKNLGFVSYSHYIKNGDDLNNYTKVGDYISLSSSITQSLSNKPNFTDAFKLTVEYDINNQRIIQKIIRNNVNIEIYYRYKTDSWGSWEKVSFKSRCQARISNALTLSGSTDYIKIPLNVIENNTSKFSLDNGEVKVSFGGYYKTSGFIILNGIHPDDKLNIAVFKNGSRIARYFIKANNDEMSMIIPDFITACNANDKLSLYVRNQTSASSGITVNNAFIIEEL